MVSVIIPTYKEPHALDVCLKSAIEGQTNKNQIIVVVDGFYDINKEVLDKYSKHIDVLNLPENRGLNTATNFGVYNASSDKILIVNDDNVFDKGWDVKLEEIYDPNIVWAPNQIEPNPGIFQQFVIHPLGTVEDFDINKFWEYTETINRKESDDCGSTLPIFMNKTKYLQVGGWDETYPGPWVVDWEFFMKCEMMGMEMKRTYNTHFYHFVSVGTRKVEPEVTYQKGLIERECHEYFKYKWGFYGYRDGKTNSNCPPLFKQ
jgi:glycosyltransferase involved in cell wall biosynthesis